jgi:hypothetical protein
VSSSVLEIVELPDGDIVLRRADDDSEPLLNIRFSDETDASMPQIRLEVAKAMIQAGIQAYAELTEQVAYEEAEADMVPVEHVVH